MNIVQMTHHRLSSEVVRLHILFLFHDAQVAVDLVDITRDLNKTSITARLIYKTDQLWVPHILCVNVDHAVVVHHLGESQVDHKVSTKQRHVVQRSPPSPRLRPTCPSFPPHSQSSWEQAQGFL